jgi:hypothetical protein
MDMISRKGAVELIRKSHGQIFTAVFWKKPIKATESDMTLSGVTALEDCPKYFVGKDAEGKLTGKVILNIKGKFMVRERRKMNCRTGVKQHKDKDTGEVVGLTGKGMAYDPKEYNLLTVFSNDKQEYRMINALTLQEIRIKGKVLHVKEAYDTEGNFKLATTVDLR